MIQWGCIADDLTGATDLATNLVTGGFRTKIVFGSHERNADNQSDDLFKDTDAIVVALKSRTAQRQEAVSASLAAYKLLKEAGAARIYLKYCSTFDSTSEGNIGPVIDAILSATGERITIVVPSFPDAGRTVYQGHLFVGDQLLNESAMAHHPLTPMRDSSLRRLLASQTIGHVELITLEVVRKGATHLKSSLEALRRQDSQHVLAIVDALTVDDLRTIATATSCWRVITGGSGLAQGLAAEDGSAATRNIPVIDGYRAILCGSASQQTRTQLRHARGHHASRKLDLSALSDSFDATVAEIIRWVRKQWAGNKEAAPLIYSTDSLSDLGPSFSSDEVMSTLVERAFAAVANGLVDAGARQLIVAGGETSGSIIAALGVRDLTIGPAIASGVAWCAGSTASGITLNLALKSGNFGPDDFFESAWPCLMRFDRMSR